MNRSSALTLLGWWREGHLLPGGVPVLVIPRGSLAEYWSTVAVQVFSVAFCCVIFVIIIVRSLQILILYYHLKGRIWVPLCPNQQTNHLFQDTCMKRIRRHWGNQCLLILCSPMFTWVMADEMVCVWECVKSSIYRLLWSWSCSIRIYFRLHFIDLFFCI